MIFAVFDTNVLIASLLSKHADSAIVQVVDAISTNKIIPLYNYEILSEYDEVLHRDKFQFNKKRIEQVLSVIQAFGVDVGTPTTTGEILQDEDDLVFYEVVMEKRSDDAYLITGNVKHFPHRTFIVTPAEMIQILSLSSQSETTHIFRSESIMENHTTNDISTEKDLSMPKSVIEAPFINIPSLKSSLEDNQSTKSPLSENAWGLVLSGGGGKGAYQVGVWRALCEMGWDTRIKAISGASVGALNAVLLASVSQPRAAVIWKSITPLQFLDIDIPFEGDGIFSREGLTQLIQANLDLTRVKDNPMDLYANTSQLEEDGHYITRYYHLNEKNAQEIQQILLASSAIPVAYSSVMIDDRPQRDGGYTTPYPVKPLRDLGLKKILVVAISLTDFDPALYPDIDFLVIKPSRDIGYLLDGTLDFTAEGARYRMELGYRDALRTLRAYEEGELDNPDYAKAHAIDANTDYQQIKVDLRKDQLNQAVDEHKSKLDDILKKYGIDDLDL